MANICRACGARIEFWLHFDCPKGKYTLPESEALESLISASEEAGFTMGKEAGQILGIEEEAARQKSVLDKLKGKLKAVSGKYAAIRKKLNWTKAALQTCNNEKQRLLFAQRRKVN